MQCEIAPLHRGTAPSHRRTLAPSHVELLLAELAQHLRRDEPDQFAGAPRAQRRNVDAAHAALFEDERTPGSQQVRGQLAEAGLVSNQGHSSSTGGAREVLNHGPGGVSGRERLQQFDGRLTRYPGRKQIRGLFRPDERARKDLIDRDIERGESLDCRFEPLDTAIGQRTLGVIRPFRAPLGRDGMAHQIDFAGRHERALGGARGVALRLGDRLLTDRQKRPSQRHVVAVKLATLGLEDANESIQMSRELEVWRAR